MTSRAPQLLILTVLIAGCVNMPTNPEDITPTYVASTKYQPLECQALKDQLGLLEHHETLLVQGQQRRISRSKGQAA